MLLEQLTLRAGVVAIAWLCGGALAGFCLSRALRTRLRRGAAGPETAGDVAVDAFGELTLVWLALGGAYAASVALPLRSGTAHAVETTLLIGVILWATVVAGHVVRDIGKLYVFRTGGPIPAGSILVNAVRIGVFVIGMLILLQTLGISIAPLLTALGVGGLAVALALKDSMANMFAGIHILASRQLRIGDFVRLDSGQEGYVTDINWRTTSIRQLPNTMVVVPNARLAESILVNYYQPEQEMSVLIDLAVTYESDLEAVERLTIDVARAALREVEGAVPEFEPFIRFHTFGDSSVEFTVVLRVREFTNQFLLRHEFLKRIQRRYAREGIETPSPRRIIMLEDEVTAQRQGLRRAQ